MTLLVSDFFSTRKMHIEKKMSIRYQIFRQCTALGMLLCSFCHSYDSVIKIFVAFFFLDPQSRFVIDSTTAEVSVNAKLIEGQSTVVLKVTYISLFTRIGSHVRAYAKRKQPDISNVIDNHSNSLCTHFFLYCIALLYIRAICSDYGQLYLEGIVIGKLTSNTTVRLLPGHSARQPDPTGRGTAPPGRHRSGR